MRRGRRRRRGRGRRKWNGGGYSLWWAVLPAFEGGNAPNTAATAATATNDYAKTSLVAAADVILQGKMRG